MSSLEPRIVDSPHSISFRENLARNVIITLLILSLLPIAFVGSATYFRTHQMLSDQVESQLETIIKNQSKQLSLESIPGNKAMTDLYVQGNFSNQLFELYNNPGDPDLIKQIQSDYFNRYLSRSSVSSFSVFDQLWGITNEGSVLIASDSRSIGEDFSQLEVFQSLKNTNYTKFAYDPQPLYTDQMVIFTALNIKDNNGSPFLTIIGATISNTPLTTLATTNSFFKASNTYLFYENGQVISVTQTGQQMFNLKPNPKHLLQLQGLVRDGQGFGKFTSLDNTEVLAYAKWIPELQVGLALEVPQDQVYREFNALLRFNILLLIGIVLITGIVTYFTANRVISPLRTIIDQARMLAKGGLSQRTEIKRHDEIGLLAHTFNSMAMQLSNLYQSLEQKVAERTEQLRSVSDIIQLATSTARQEDILQRTVDLLVDRFEYLYAGIFTLNETATSATLVSEASTATGEHKFLGYRVRTTDHTLIGWAANHNKPRSVFSNPESAESWPLRTDQTRSEVAVPVQVGGEVYGVLYLQSAKEDAFEEDTLTALQTLGGQIAIGLQKIRLLESAEINLEETSALYNISLKITQTKHKTELIHTLLDGLNDFSMITGIYAVEENQVRLLGINNPDKTARTIAQPDTTFPLSNAKEHFSDSSLIILDDLSVTMEFNQILSDYLQAGCTSAALFGIKESGKLALMIVLAFQNQTIPTSTRLQPFVNLVHVTSSALDRLQVTQDLEMRLNELQTMSDISQAISNETDLNHLYQVLYELISAVIGQGLTFTIALYDKQNEKIEIPFLYENGTISTLDPLPFGEGLTSHIIQTREPLLIKQNIEKEARDLGAKIIGNSPKSWLGVPLMASSEVIGAMIFQDSEHENRFNEHDLTLLNTLASQVGAAIQNAQLVTGLQQALKVYDQERFLLNTLLENIPDQIFFKDKEGKYLRASNSYAAQFSLLPDELVGKSDFDLFESEISYQLAEEEINLLHNGQNRLETVIRKHSDEGARTWYHVSKIPLQDNNAQPAGIFSISRDITDLKMTEETATLRAKQLQTAAEIARDTTGTLDVNEFLAEAVNLIRDRFGFYHSSIFLMDPLGQNAILRESTGEAGEQLKHARHQLAVGSQSLVGQATKNRTPVVINDVTSDPNYYPNPFLPDTRSELVLPLTVGDQLLGVLDVQSTQINAFLAEDLEILQIVADQLAAAILSATLYTNSRKNFNRQQALQDITIQITASGTFEEFLMKTVEGLHTILPEARVTFYTLNQMNQLELQASAGYQDNKYLPGLINLAEGIIGESASQRAPILIKDSVTEQHYLTINENTRSELAIPILYNDQLFGVLNLESETIAAFDENDREIFTVWSNNIGAALSNLQLLNQIRTQVDKQRAINQISSNIHRSVDIGLILETSATEICKALGAKRASIKINPELSVENSENNGNNGSGKMEEF